MTNPGIHVEKVVAHGRFWEAVRDRFATLLVRARSVARAAGPWARQHQNWFWLALAAILGLAFLYVLFASQSPRWH